MYLILNWLWEWLLQDFPRHVLAAVIIVAAVALIMYSVLSKILGRERTSTGDWRSGLYQQIRDHVDRLHHVLTVLKQQLELAEIYDDYHYKLDIKEFYRESLESLKQELSCLEEICYRKQPQKNHMSHSKGDSLEITRNGLLGRQTVNETGELPSTMDWHNKCVINFPQCIQSREFCDSELHDSNLPLYQYRKGIKGSGVDRDICPCIATEELGGCFIFPAEEPPLYTGGSEMQPSQTADMLGKTIISEAQQADLSESMTVEIQTPDLSRSVFSEFQSADTSGCMTVEIQTPESLEGMIAEIQSPYKVESIFLEIQTADIPESMFVEIQTTDIEHMVEMVLTQGIPESIFLEIQTTDIPESIFVEIQTTDIERMVEMILTQGMPDFGNLTSRYARKCGCGDTD